jgi:hypothetical protein
MNTGVPGQDFPGSDLGMAVQVVENRHGQETMHPMGAGFTLVFVKLAPFGSVPILFLDRIAGFLGLTGSAGAFVARMWLSKKKTSACEPAAVSFF